MTSGEPEALPRAPIWPRSHGRHRSTANGEAEGRAPRPRAHLREPAFQEADSGGAQGGGGAGAARA
eukprot:3680000-Pyramimonas_sp.AAC.1